MHKKLNIYEKKIEIYTREIDILSKKSNLIYWIVLILVVGVISLNINIYNSLLVETNKQEMTLNMLNDREVDKFYKLLSLDKKGNYYEQIKIQYNEVLDRNNKVLNSVINLKSKIHNKVGTLVTGTIIVAFLSLTYLFLLWIRILSREKEIKNLEVKILNIMKRS